VAPLKHQQISTRLYGITSQKTLFFTVIYVRISSQDSSVSPNCLYNVGLYNTIQNANSLYHDYGTHGTNSRNFIPYQNSLQTIHQMYLIF